MISTVIAAMMAVSCMDEVENPMGENKGELVEMTFTASYADATKTVLDGLNVNWLPGDEIAVNGERFTTDIQEISSDAVFKGKVAQVPPYSAVYPYEMVSTFDDSNVSLTLPQTQKAVSGSFADDLNIATAYAPAASMPLVFHNMLGYIKFTVDESLAGIRSLTVTPKDEVGVAWNPAATVNCSVPEWGLTPDWSSIDTENGFVREAVLVAEDTFTPGDAYYIALFPGTYYYGLDLTFENTDGLVSELSISSMTLELKPGEIKNIGTIRNLEFYDKNALSKM